MSGSLRMYFHAPEFENHEKPTPKSNPFLPIKNGAGRRDLDRRHDEEHEREPDRARQRYQREIESSLPARHPHLELSGRFRKLERSSLEWGRRNLGNHLPSVTHRARLRYRPVPDRK
jgi:hypothetical protein